MPPTLCLSRMRTQRKDLFAANTQWQICCHHTISCPSQLFQSNGFCIHLDWPMNFRRCHEISTVKIHPSQATKRKKSPRAIPPYSMRFGVCMSALDMQTPQKRLVELRPRSPKNLVMHFASWSSVVQLTEGHRDGLSKDCASRTCPKSLPTEVLSQTSGKNMVQQNCIPITTIWENCCFVQDCRGR